MTRDDSTHLLLIERDRDVSAVIDGMLTLSWSGGLSFTIAQQVDDVSPQLIAGGVSAVLLGGSEQNVSLERLRALAPDVPVVVLSSDYSDGAALVALRAGAQDVLAKAHMSASSLRCALRHAIERKRSHEHVAQRALQDPLTGLPNRTLFLDRLGVALERTRRTGAVTGVLFLDVDHFKVINDTFGHAAGDRVLSALAGRLHTVLRPMDTVARFGGDEFTFLFEDLSNPEEALAIAERVRHAANLPIGVGDDRYDLAVSIGVATTSGPAISPEALLAEADAAMYQAKRRGGGEATVVEDDESQAEEATVIEEQRDNGQNGSSSESAPAGSEPVAQPASRSEPIGEPASGMEPASGRDPIAQPASRPATPSAGLPKVPPELPPELPPDPLAGLAEELRHALDRSELKVLYQPQYELGEHDRVLGFEALVRWQHPERGLIAPGVFIPIADRIGLTTTIGQFVLGQSLGLLARLQASRSDLTVSINVSPIQLAAPELAAALAAVAAAGLAPGSVCVDIAEKTVSQSPAAVIEASRVLKAGGIRVAIDDYGTGAAPLNSIRSLGADQLKIAPSFVGELDSTAGDRSMVAAVVELGHALGMTVIAEGVETAQQLIGLRSLGCDSAQGFLLSRPMSAEQLEQLVAGA